MSIEGSASVAAACLALVLLWAAASKLRNPALTAKEFRHLGLPSVAGRLVPVAEIATAGALLMLPKWGAVFAFFLLAAFTSILFTLVRSKSAHSCACFGQTSKGPAGKLDLLRNAVLLGFSILSSTIDSLSTPRILDVLVVAGLAVAAVGYPLVTK